MKNCKETHWVIILLLCGGLTVALSYFPLASEKRWVSYQEASTLLKQNASKESLRSIQLIDPHPKRVRIKTNHLLFSRKEYSLIAISYF